MESRHKHYSYKLFQIGGKWTSSEPVRGWRHFRISTVEKKGTQERKVELMAVCDPKVRFWVPVVELKKLELWSAGWL